MNSLERAAYLAHARTKAFRRKHDAALEFLDDAQDAHLSISWGKDGTALALLLHVAGGKPRLLNACYPNPNERLSDMDRVRDAYLNRFGCEYLEVAPPGEWEMYQRVGHFFASPNTPQERDAARWWKQGFLTEMKRGREALGSQGTLLGLRAQESHARRMNTAMHGTRYTRADGETILTPLAHWTGRDVWALLTLHDAPYLRIYDVAVDRERARSGFVFGTGGGDAIRRHGVWQDWQRAYPREFGAWLTQFPDLQALLV